MDLYISLLLITLMLVDKLKYLEAGVHIGTKTCTPGMKRFIYKIRADGVAVFNLQKVDERIGIAAQFLARFKKPLFVGRKEVARQALTKFAEATGCKTIAGRFSPGTITNPSFRDFFEPDVIFVIDTLIDSQAVKEGKKKRIPIVALCGTFNSLKDVDLVVPANNNGKKSIGFILWVLAREFLKKKGRIKKDSEFKFSPEDFGVEKGEENENEPKEIGSEPAEVRDNKG